MNELSEFYPYVEMPEVVKKAEEFRQHHHTRTSLAANPRCPAEVGVGWTETSSVKRKQYVEEQLELIESPVHPTRRAAQSRILYLLQGARAVRIHAERQPLTQCYRYFWRD